MLNIKYQTQKNCSAIALTLLLTTLTACETAPTRHEKSIAKHPEWSAQTIALIRDGKVFKGMTKEQVRAAWGRHCFTCQGTTKGTWGESWEYSTQVVFFDLEGKVNRLATK